jgi:DNA-binding Lrp family transcriptional regulator
MFPSSGNIWEVVLADGFGDIELFCAVVEAGGISAGAEALGSSPPAVSRRVKALEARLGVRLADRSARRFRLTDEGALYYEHCRNILKDLRDAEAEVSARGATARGILRIGAPMELGRRRIGTCWPNSPRCIRRSKCTWRCPMRDSKLERTGSTSPFALVDPMILR